MASSDIENKKVARAWHDEIKPRVVVDIGAGQGTYAALCKKGAKWIAIEVFYPYIETYDLRRLYDKIVIADVRYAHLRLIERSPDLVIIGDVLEHMKKGQAKQVITRLLHWSKNVIISVPLLHRKQGATHGNPFETHIDHWGHDEMVEFLGKRLRKHKKGRILGYYWCT